jgi:FtsH-binding integral membrane protein
VSTEDQHDSADHQDRQRSDQEGSQSRQMRGMYLRFAAMILTAMVVMYWVMFVGSWEWSHVRFSQSRVFMAITMGGTMGLIMLAWMLNMYKNTKANVAIVVASLVLLAGGTALDRSQVTVDDTAFMSAMIPHHSLAITRSERAQITDVRVCQLAVEIIEAQNREIAEMDWLIEDIQRNGLALTPEEADARPVPAFPGTAIRDCPTP